MLSLASGASTEKLKMPKLKRGSSLNTMPTSQAVASQQEIKAVKVDNKSLMRELDGGDNEKEEEEDENGNIFAIIKEEALDIVEGFLYAKSNYECIEHAFEVLDRHKTIVGVAGGAWFLKGRLFSRNISKNIAKNQLDTLRMKEINKWGRRAF